MKRASKIALAALVVIAGVLLGYAAMPSRSTDPAPASGRIGIFTTLPLLWSEGEVADLLASQAAPHWALAVLEQSGRPVPLDSLAGAQGRNPLRGVGRLLIAQPRPLSPDENVALDAWVRGGGQLLLFVDPMLTQHSTFSIGDPRRPQDVVLISPLLGHWGLALAFDDQQPGGERSVPVLGRAMPVNLAGQLAFIASGAKDCRILDQGMLAQCDLGKGRALVVADAALLEADHPGEEQARVEMLQALLQQAFAPRD